MRYCVLIRDIPGRGSRGDREEYDQKLIDQGLAVPIEILDVNHPPVDIHPSEEQE